MKFQNPSLKFFLNGRTDARTHTRTEARTSRNQYAPHFFKVGGIKKNVFTMCMITVAPLTTARKL